MISFWRTVMSWPQYHAPISWNINPPPPLVGVQGEGWVGGDDRKLTAYKMTLHPQTLTLLPTSREVGSTNVWEKGAKTRVPRCEGEVTTYSAMMTSYCTWLTSCTTWLTSYKVIPLEKANQSWDWHLSMYIPLETFHSWDWHLTSCYYRNDGCCMATETRWTGATRRPRKPHD